MKDATDELKIWICEHYGEHIQDGAINVDTLTDALAAEFNRRSNPRLKDFVVNTCLTIQAIAQAKQKAGQ
jgi:hypothetical protein